MAVSNTYSDCPALLRDFLFYLQTIKGHSMRTVNAYYVDLRLFLKYLKYHKGFCDPSCEITELDISDLSTEVICSVRLGDIYEYLNYALQDRSNNANTRARKVSSLRSFYKYVSTKTTLLTENPLKDLELPSSRKSVPKYLTLQESISLIDHLDPTDKDYARDYCIITLFLNCGMRLSELVGINISDIRDDTVKLLGKGNKERIVYLNEACLEAIKAYLAVRGEPKTAADRHALFLSRVGKRISPRRVQQIIEEALKSSGLDGRGYSTHKLRHTAATLMYQHGNVDIRVLKEILGHANLGTTEIYTHISDSQLQNAAMRSPLANHKARRTPEQAAAAALTEKENNGGNDDDR